MDDVKYNVSVYELKTLLKWTLYPGSFVKTVETEDIQETRYSCRTQT